MKRFLVFGWKTLAGAVLCMGLVPSVVVVGWVQRAMQRSVLTRWFLIEHPPEQLGDFLGADASSAVHSHWPNWIKCAGKLRSPPDLLASLWLNIKLGIGAIFNTWVLTLPVCGLWLFAWYDGWNNSFTKGYEQAGVGPAIGLLGVALFIVVMLYLPMAQARQASTGSWRAFYEFPLVWGLIRRRWWACVKLALLYSILSIPVTALKTAPMMFNRLPGYADSTDAEVLEFLGTYFFLGGVVVFGIYLCLRLSAAKVYADSVIAAIRAGDLEPEQLGGLERNILARLDLLDADTQPERGAIVRVARGFSFWTLRCAATAVAVIIWFSFVAQIFVSEFLNYHPVVGWLNQPLVQLPWFRYMP